MPEELYTAIALGVAITVGTITYKRCRNDGTVTKGILSGKDRWILYNRRVC